MPCLNQLPYFRRVWLITFTFGLDISLFPFSASFSSRTIKIHLELIIAILEFELAAITQ